MENLQGAQTPVDQATMMTREPELPNAVRLRPKTITAKDEEEPSMSQQGTARKKAKGTLKHSRDENIMGTNNSSIASKRSVERLYVPLPHFFRYFVKKLIRRSPLINRGYWLRMHAVETVLSDFLDKPTEKKKVIVNLGCG
ncbi:MAG: hypothetical protein Q9208_000072 [Pyrenodesmia sp. 3 TL-2023]